MPLFVTEQDVIVIEVCYLEENGQLKFLEEGDDSCQKPQVETFTFRRPNWSDNRLMMADSMFIDPTSGAPVLDPYRFIDRKMKILLKEWTLKVGDEKLPVTGDNIDKLDAALINYLNRALDAKLTPPVEEAPKQ
jgi:hypothetical protein